MVSCVEVRIDAEHRWQHRNNNKTKVGVKNIKEKKEIGFAWRRDQGSFQVDSDKRFLDSWYLYSQVLRLTWIESESETLSVRVEADAAEHTW